MENKIDLLKDWRKLAEMIKNGQITKEELNSLKNRVDEIIKVDKLRNFKCSDGTTIDLVALRDSVEPYVAELSSFIHELCS